MVVVVVRWTISPSAVRRVVRFSQPCCALPYQAAVRGNRLRATRRSGTSPAVCAHSYASHETQRSTKEKQHLPNENQFVPSLP